MFRLGCAEQELKIPRFIELYGYGPYAGRRSIGVLEPLYCRAFSFYDGKHRAMIVYSDTCTTDDLYARELRAKIASRLRIRPEGIAITATHTHSGPALSDESTDTSGIRNAEWQDYWKQSMLNVAMAAFADEEEIGSAEIGKAPLDQPVGRNRVDPETNLTDPVIRWIRFHRKDGSAKLLIHNYAAHGISDNGELYRYASSDWMGSANRYIHEKGLADFGLFLQGAAGDQNTRVSCYHTKRKTAGRELAEEYVSYLGKDLAKGKNFNPEGISFQLKSVNFPGVRQNAEELRKDAAAYENRGKSEAEKAYWKINGQRLSEMALLAEQGYNLDSVHDLQIIRMGKADFFFIPGELFLEPGLELLKKASSPYSFLSTLSNGNGAYFFTEKVAKMYPSAFSESSVSFGYYEIYGYMHQLRYKYPDNIADFLVNSLLTLEKEIN